MSTKAWFDLRKLPIRYDRITWHCKWNFISQIFLNSLATLVLPAQRCYILVTFSFFRTFFVLFRFEVQLIKFQKHHHLVRSLWHWCLSYCVALTNGHSFDYGVWIVNCTPDTGISVLDCIPAGSGVAYFCAVNSLFRIVDIWSVAFGRWAALASYAMAAFSLYGQRLAVLLLRPLQTMLVAPRRRASVGSSIASQRFPLARQGRVQMTACPTAVYVRTSIELYKLDN